MKITKEQKELFNQGFIKYNNIELIEVTEERTVLKTKINENSLNPYGIVHGGLLFGIADTAMGVAASVKGNKSVTTTANITYIKPATGKELTCIATPIKIGKTMTHLEAKIYNEKEELVATATSSYFNLD